MKREHLIKFKIVRSYIKNLIDLKKIPGKADQKGIDKKARQINIGKQDVQHAHRLSNSSSQGKTKQKGKRLSS